MALPVTASFANPDPASCPATFGDLITLLNTLLSASVPGSYLPYVGGSATPSSDDQNKVWMRVDGAGRPLAAYIYYNGAWRRFASGLIGEVRYYRGDPALYFNSTGKGLQGLEWDGWALCNGQNGTPNLTDRFIVGAKLDDLSIGYSGGWKSNVSGSAQAFGGDKNVTLTLPQIPRAAVAEVALAKWKADGNTPDASSGLVGINPIPANKTVITAADAGNLSPTAVPTLPPYLALALVTFIGYD